MPVINILILSLGLIAYVKVFLVLRKSLSLYWHEILLPIYPILMFYLFSGLGLTKTSQGYEADIFRFMLLLGGGICLSLLRCIPTKKPKIYSALLLFISFAYPSVICLS